MDRDTVKSILIIDVLCICVTHANAMTGVPVIDFVNPAPECKNSLSLLYLIFNVYVYYQSFLNCQALCFLAMV